MQTFDPSHLWWALLLMVSSCIAWTMAVKLVVDRIGEGDPVAFHDGVRRRVLAALVLASAAVVLDPKFLMPPWSIRDLIAGCWAAIALSGVVYVLARRIRRRLDP